MIPEVKIENLVFVLLMAGCKLNSATEYHTSYYLFNLQGQATLFSAFCEFLRNFGSDVKKKLTPACFTGCKIHPAFAKPCKKVDAKIGLEPTQIQGSCNAAVPEVGSFIFHSASPFSFFTSASKCAILSNSPTMRWMCFPGLLPK